WELVHKSNSTGPQERTSDNSPAPSCQGWDAKSKNCSPWRATDKPIMQLLTNNLSRPFHGLRAFHIDIPAPSWSGLGYYHSSTICGLKAKNTFCAKRVTGTLAANSNRNNGD